MLERRAQTLDSEVKYSGKVSRVSVTIGPSSPEAETQADTKSGVLTREEFEDALDKVSRPKQTPEKA